VTGPVDHPLGVDRHGGTARTDRHGYLRDLVEQVLFTAPGERVNRPGFGAGVAQLLFAAASPEIAATAQVLVQGALQQWLGDVIDVEGVQVTVDDATLVIEVAYTERVSQRSETARFSHPGGLA
jgi:uncharacterized protein